MRAQQWWLLQELVNKFLQLDDETCAMLDGLSGKYVLVQLRGPAMEFCVAPCAQGITLSSGEGVMPDVTLRCRMMDCFHLLFSPVERRPLPKDVEISGDILILQELQKVFARFDPDWQEPLSRVLGGTATHKLGNFLSLARTQLRASSQHMLMDVGEYLRYEKKLLPSANELDEFLGAVDQLRGDVDRFEQRLRALTPAPAGDAAASNDEETR